MNFLPLTKEEEKKCFELLFTLSKQAQRTMKEETWKTQIENGHQTLIKICQLSCRMYNYLLLFEGNDKITNSIPFFSLYRPDETNYISIMLMYGFCKCIHQVCQLQLEEMKKKTMMKEKNNRWSIFHHFSSSPALDPLSATAWNLYSAWQEELPAWIQSDVNWDFIHDDKILKAYMDNLKKTERLIRPVLDLFQTFYPSLREHHPTFLSYFSDYEILHDILLPISKGEKILSYVTIFEMVQEISCKS